MAGPFNNEPLFPPKPTPSSTGNTQAGSSGRGGAAGSGDGSSVFEDMSYNAERQKQKGMPKKRNADNKPKQQQSQEGKKSESGGKSQSADRNWYCEVCKVKTTCSENLEAHFKGQKHKSNLAKLGLQADVGRPQSGPSRTPLKLNVAEEIMKNSHPLIGVECLTEYEHIEPVQDPHYECSVCELLLMPGNAIPHLMGYKHRIKYVEAFRPELFNKYIRPTADKYNLLTSQGEFSDDEKKGKGTLSGRARDLAIEIEKREGRRLMKTVVLRGQKVPNQLRMGQIHFSEIGKMGGRHDWSFKAVDNGWNFSEDAMKNWGDRNEGPLLHGPGPMGMRPDGPGPMGMGPDGPGMRGMGPDGPGMRGMGPDGPGPMGMRPDGPGPMGMRPDGPGMRDMGPDGPGPMGMRPDGPGNMGMRPDGPGNMGMRPDGPGNMGMRPDGPGNMGMRPDGPGPMGMGPDGPGHMRGHMGMGHDGPGPMGLGPMGPDVGGPGWMGPRAEGPGFHEKPFLSEADIRPELLSDEFIKREYERRFGGKNTNTDQPPLPDGPPSKKPRPPPPPGNASDSDVDSSEKMQNLFNELSTSMIKNEEDASMALQVSNTLTQALLNYRLKSLPEGASLLG